MFDQVFFSKQYSLSSVFHVFIIYGFSCMVRRTDNSDFALRVYCLNGEAQFYTGKAENIHAGCPIKYQDMDYLVLS